MIKQIREYLARGKQSTLYSNAFYLMLNTGAGSLLGFVFWNVMARYYNQADVGIGSAVMAASGLISVIANLGLGTGLVRFMPEMGERKVSFNNTAFTLAGVIGFVGALIYMLGTPVWAPAMVFIRRNPVYLLFFVIVSVSLVVGGICDSSFVAGRASKYVFLRNLLTNVLRIPIPILIFFSLKGYGIFIGYGITVIAALLLALFIFLPKVYSGYRPRPEWKNDIMKQVIPFSFANYLAGLLNATPTYIYPLMVLNVLGAAQNAHFYVAWMIAMVLTVIPSGLSQSLFAESANNPDDMARSGRKALFLSLILSVPAVAAIVLIGPWILHFFGHSYAANGNAIIRTLTYSLIPFCINNFYIIVNQIKKQINYILYQTTFIAVFSLGIGYWMLIHYGLYGLGLAYTLTQTILACILIWPLSREFHIFHGEKKLTKEAS